MDDNPGGLSDRLRFFSQNDDISTISEGGIRIRFLNNGPQIGMFIEITPETTCDEIKKAWPLVREWEKRLTDFQGPRMFDKPGFYHSLYRMRERRGNTYAEIARHLNENVSRHLLDYVGSENANSYDEMKDVPEERRILAPFGLENAREILNFCKVKDVEVWIQEGLRQIRNGEQPFNINDEPIDREKIIYLIRRWKGSEEFKIVIEKGW